MMLSLAMLMLAPVSEVSPTVSAPLSAPAKNLLQQLAALSLSKEKL